MAKSLRSAFYDNDFDDGLDLSMFLELYYEYVTAYNIPYDIFYVNYNFPDMPLDNKFIQYVKDNKSDFINRQQAR